LHSYQLELHTQLTKITEQAQDVLRHIATFGNNSSQNQGGLEAKNEEGNKTTEDDKGEISFGEELKEIFESNSETGDGERKLGSEQDVFDIQASEVNVHLSEEKQLEYKRILENIVQDVQSSLGRFS
jgi:Mg2+ and Co2+ transporter CorA